MIKTSTPAHTKRETHGQKHEATRRKTTGGDISAERTKNRTFIIFPGKPLIISCLFFPGTKKKKKNIFCINRGYIFKPFFLRDIDIYISVILWEILAHRIKKIAELLLKGGVQGRGKRAGEGGGARERDRVCVCVRL